MVYGRDTALFAGKLVENIIQAIARDILVEAIRKLEAAGLPVVLHVHDEVVVEIEVSRAQETVEQVRMIMTTLPQWAAGLPLACEVSVANRYGNHISAQTSTETRPTITGVEPEERRS